MSGNDGFSRQDLFQVVGALLVSLAFRAPWLVSTLVQNPPVSRPVLTSFLELHGVSEKHPVDCFRMVQDHTAVVPDHGGTGGRAGVSRGVADTRRAAATGRRALPEVGAKESYRPVSELARRR